MSGSRRSSRLALAAAAATLALSGCSALHPGAAAVVDGATIDHDAVDDVALALCAANVSSAAASGQAPPELATRGAREAALQILLEAEVTRQFAADLGVAVRPQELSDRVVQAEQSLAALPAEHRDAFGEAVRAFNERQLLLIAAGRTSLGASVPEDQALAEGQRLQQEYLQGVDVEVDPRYGSYEQGAFRPGTRSLSVPASGSAVDGGSANPSEAWVSALPASQKCG